LHIQALFLGEVDYVELDRPGGLLVQDLEVKPLVVASGVRIDAHVQVEFILVHFDGHVQVATLEVRFKDHWLLPVAERVKIGLLLLELFKAHFLVTNAMLHGLECFHD